MDEFQYWNNETIEEITFNSEIFQKNLKNLSNFNSSFSIANEFQIKTLRSRPLEKFQSSKQLIESLNSLKKQLDNPVSIHFKYNYYFKNSVMDRLCAQISDSLLLNLNKTNEQIQFDNVDDELYSSRKIIIRISNQDERAYVRFLCQMHLQMVKPMLDSKKSTDNRYSFYSNFNRFYSYEISDRGKTIHDTDRAFLIATHYLNYEYIVGNSSNSSTRLVNNNGKLCQHTFGHTGHYRNGFNPFHFFDIYPVELIKFDLKHLQFFYN